MLKSQSHLLAKYNINERGKLINKTCLRYPFPHLHLSSRHGFRSYISSLSLLAVEYDLAVSSDSLLCRCSYYNNSVHELQVFESIYRGLKETTPCHPPSWLRLTAIISASGFFDVIENIQSQCFRCSRACSRHIPKGSASAADGVTFQDFQASASTGKVCVIRKLLRTAD